MKVSINGYLIIYSELILLMACLFFFTASMLKNVAEILPTLSSDQVHTLVIDWENSYGKNQGRIFNESITGVDNFSWSISVALEDILDSMNIRGLVDRGTFDMLVKSWGNLIPWDQTQETLEIISNAGFKIGTLSNGDQITLKRATDVFLPNVKFDYVFGSEFPVGSFKPDSAMYHQLENYGFEREEILHIAGGETDAQGARDANIFSAFNQVLYPSTTPIDNDDICFLLANITEVPAILGIE